MRVGDPAATKLWLLERWAAKEARLKSWAGVEIPEGLADPEDHEKELRRHAAGGLAAAVVTVGLLWFSSRVRLLALASALAWQGLAFWGGLDAVELKVGEAARDAGKWEAWDY